MQIPQTGGQSKVHDLMDFSGTITTGGTAQLVLPQMVTRSYVQFINNSSGNLVIDWGPATATCTLSGGAVNAITIANAGMGYLIAPQVLFLGGVVTGDFTKNPGGFPNQGGRAAKATAFISAGAVSSIVVSDPGAGYLVAPTIYLCNNIDGTNPGADLGGGARIPSASSGIVIVPNGSITYEEAYVPTSALAVFGATTAQAFTCKISVN